MRSALAPALTAALIPALIYGLGQADRATACVACAPGFDVADYLNRALDLRDAAASGGLLGALAAPDPHPPGHPAALALAMSVAGAELPALRRVMLTLFGLALALLPWLGWIAGGRRGLLAGGLAALLTVSSPEHVLLAATPMTEDLALVATLLALGLLMRALARPGLGPALLAGVAVLGATLVRYNLAPMLLVPAWLAWGADRLRAGGRADARPLAFAAPTALVLGLWWGLEPEAFEAARRFLHNVDSGLPTWSVDNWLWAPRTLAAHYGHGAAPALALGGLALAGQLGAWRDGSRGGERLLGLFVALGLLAITLHPYKLARTLHPLLPALALLAGLALARARWRTLDLGPPLLGVGLLAALAQVIWPPALVGRPELSENPAQVALLDAVAERARGARAVVVLGITDDLSHHLLRLHLRSALPGLEVLIEPPPTPACLEGPADAAPPECHPPHTLRALREGGALWVVLTRGSTRAGVRPRQAPRAGSLRPPRADEVHWSLWSAALFEALAEEAGLPPGERLAIPGRRGRARGELTLRGPAPAKP